LAFVDETNIEVSSGDGGPGAATFRREKYAPKGGPDGGDGGRGGDVVFRVKNNLKTLSDLATRRYYHAEKGLSGQKRKRHGRDGEPEIIEVPPGTIIRSIPDGRLIKDLVGGEEWTFLRGGKGGKGNVHFASSVRQTPRYAQPGLPGETVSVRVELNLVADLGFVGMPNAGKSTLLSVLTNATPKVASYPFTTKVPNLGVMRENFVEVILADIPGLIEGASGGAGLGIRFLKHISRTTSLVFLVDLSSDDYLDAFPVLLNELAVFQEALAQKKRIIVGTKTDTDESEGRAAELREHLPDEEVLEISSFAFRGIEALKRRMVRLAQEAGNARAE
jgi:GTPase